MKTLFISIIFITQFFGSLTLGQTINILEDLVKQNSEKLSPVIENLDKYEVQILYTQIDRDENGEIKFNTFSFNEKPKKYFYPASTVKLPAAVLALEKINEINVDGLNKFTHLSIDSVYEGHVSFGKNYKDECGYPNIANYIKQIFLVSDNESFNRLYDFLGQKEINERLKNRGFNNTKIIHRLEVARTADQNMQTNPIDFYDESGNIIYHQPERYDSIDFKLDLENTIRGKGFIQNDTLVKEPKDFSHNNYFGLRDQHNLLMRILFPEEFSKEEQFNLTLEDYKFLKKYMSMLPRESECPKYNSEEYWDSYVKFLMFGDSKEPIPRNIKIYNKVGDAYGFLTDNAYIVDEENNVEFFLSATLFLNENQIFNDDKYEYEEIGFPFMAKLGKIIYEYEKSKK
ncbi:MAG: serine hydrolase [Ignavibacteriales bacterium]|nr:serine hydrolase [Ignavibacteriales bacterium]